MKMIHQIRYIINFALSKTWNKIFSFDAAFIFFKYLKFKILKKIKVFFLLINCHFYKKNVIFFLCYTLPITFWNKKKKKFYFSDNDLQRKKYTIGKDFKKRILLDCSYLKDFFNSFFLIAQKTSMYMCKLKNITYNFN